jgi:hypothetical protein
MVATAGETEVGHIDIPIPNDEGETGLGGCRNG